MNHWKTRSRLAASNPCPTRSSVEVPSGDPLLLHIRFNGERSGTTGKSIPLCAVRDGEQAQILLSQQLLTESILLAMHGSLLGLAVAYVLADRVSFLLPDLKDVSWVGLDGRVFRCALWTAMLTGLVCGLAPALEASRVSLNESLKEGSRSVPDEPEKFVEIVRSILPDR